ncbi:MAG: hypothetical protein S4CHLAM107_11170 [Chlamydiia bacterium]|nr:hypothetical protein [Chlamydiia bacterium]
MKVAALVAPPLPTPKDVVYTEDIALVLSTVLASGSLNAVGQRLFLKYKATSSSSIEALVHLGHIISGLPTDHRNSVNDALDGVGDDKAKWLSPTRYQSTPHLYSSTPPKTSC